MGRNILREYENVGGQYGQKINTNGTDASGYTHSGGFINIWTRTIMVIVWGTRTP